VRRAVLAGLMLTLTGWAVVASSVRAQPPLPAPLTATLVLVNPPSAVTYNPSTPVAMELQLRNATGVPFLTPQGFLATEFGRRLFFTSPTGGIIINAAEAAIHGDTRSFYCLSRRGVLLRPTAIPVVPIETVPTGTPPDGFLAAYPIPDARQLYDLSLPGRYTANARIPLQVVQGDTTNLITDCDQLKNQTLVNVASVTGRQAFTVVSNSVEFVITSATLDFTGFEKPLVDDSACPHPATNPCATFPFGRDIQVKFHLFDAAHNPVQGATVHIRVVKADGSTVALKPDTFTPPKKNNNANKDKKKDSEYTYDLHTRLLSRGVWRLDAIVDADGSIHSTHFGLR
jgi:hypothetical protein